jgi:hypothetical protein
MLKEQRYELSFDKPLDTWILQNLMSRELQSEESICTGHLRVEYIKIRNIHTGEINKVAKAHLE